jgi:hypothetical protein
MGGRASLIMVIGFAVIFGIINLNIAKLTNRSLEGMVGYNESSMSRTVASSGANAGMAIFTSKSKLRGTLIDKNFTTGPFAGCGFTVTLNNISGSPAYLRLRSVSRCTTFVKDKGISVILRDTVEVRMDTTTTRTFSELGWMSNNEGTISFYTGDTLWGKVHSNSNILIDGTPRFKGKVTTAKNFNPQKNSAFFDGGKEEKVPAKDFPTDINIAKNAATNALATKTAKIWVQLMPGLSSNNNDGYALIYTAVPCTTTTVTGYDKWGHPITSTEITTVAGTKLDSMGLSDNSDKVIYSSENVYVKGTLDGRLSIASGKDLVIEGNTVYEKPPDPKKPLTDPVNDTKDMLGLIAFNDVVVSNDIHGGSGQTGLDLHAAIFALGGQSGATDGKFRAEDSDSRPVEGSIRLIGSIAQDQRGSTGSHSGDVKTHGFYKSYRYDNRMSPKDDGFVQDKDYTAQFPPSFPGWSSAGPLRIESWWESNRKPFNVDDYQ